MVGRNAFNVVYFGLSVRRKRHRRVAMFFVGTFLLDLEGFEWVMGKGGKCCKRGAFFLIFSLGVY